jgi:outer membrane protein assembly factor BamA
VLAAALLCVVVIPLHAAPLPERPVTVVRDIAVRGSDAFTPREVVSWMTLRVGAPFSPATLRNDIETIGEHCRASGYLNAAVSSVESFGADSGSVDLVITIDARRRTVFGGLRLIGNSALSSPELSTLLESRIASPLDQQTLESDVTAILGRYEKRGYPLAACRIDSMMTVSGATVDSVFFAVMIDEGLPVSIQEVRVEGNVETSTNVIVRETRLRMGEPYDPDRMQAVRARLLRLNIFSSVSEPELYLRGTMGGVLIHVQEGRTNTFDGVAGYMPGTAGADGYFTGLASVSMRNLFGTARRFQFRWQKEDRHSQDLLIGYAEPWLLGMPVNVSTEFQQRRQDTSYVRQGGNVRIEWMFSEQLSAGLIGSAESVFPSADSTIARVPRSSTASAGVDVVYDTRDDLVNPTSGARYRADYHYGRKSVRSDAAGNPSGSVQRFSVDLDSYLQVFERQVVALGIHGRQVQGSVVDESEYFRFGGTNSLRGYRENQFAGTRVGWVNTEYRLLFGRRTFVYAFVDAGYYYRSAADVAGSTGGEALQYGYGLGLRFDSPLGNLSVSFALGKGDSFAQGKVHIGILNEF